jgi:UDP-N-acetylmuramoyl-tripeptide--D-alanyl-D-alanine ligase
MAPVMLGGLTFIRDDWKAPLSTIEPAFEFMRQARATRKIIVIGTISDYQGDSTRRYVEIGQLALAFADCVVFVGPRASACLRAKRDASDELRAFPSLRDASTYLSGYLRPGDLVLLKGSHKADHMQRLIVALTTDVQCWRSDCGRMQSCDTCSLLRVPSGPEAAEELAAMPHAELESMPVHLNLFNGTRSTVVVIGLGNPRGRSLGATSGHKLGGRGRLCHGGAR